jgi:hypothetical protein
MERIKEVLLEHEIKIPVLVDYILEGSELSKKISLCRQGIEINTVPASRTEGIILNIISGDIKAETIKAETIEIPNELLMCWIHSVENNTSLLEQSVDNILDKKNNTVSSLAIMLRGDHYMKSGNVNVAKHDYLWALELSAKKYKTPIRYRLFLICGYPYKMDRSYRSYMVAFLKTYKDDIGTLYKKIAEHHSEAGSIISALFIFCKGQNNYVLESLLIQSLYIPVKQHETQPLL